MTDRTLLYGMWEKSKAEIVCAALAVRRDARISGCLRVDKRDYDSTLFFSLPYIQYNRCFWVFLRSCRGGEAWWHCTVQQQGRTRGTLRKCVNNFLYTVEMIIRIAFESSLLFVEMLVMLLNTWDFAIGEVSSMILPTYISRNKNFSAIRLMIPILFHWRNYAFH